MEALVTRASPDSLWQRSDGLALTSVGLQGPHWDVKGPRWLLSPWLSVRLKHRWQGLATISNLPEGDQRTFSAIQGRCWPAAASFVLMNHAPALSLQAGTKGSPVEIGMQTMEVKGWTTKKNHSAIQHFGGRKVRHCEQTVQSGSSKTRRMAVKGLNVWHTDTGEERINQ